MCPTVNHEGISVPGRIFNRIVEAWMEYVVPWIELLREYYLWWVVSGLILFGITESINYWRNDEFLILNNISSTLEDIYDEIIENRRELESTKQLLNSIWEIVRVVAFLAIVTVAVSLIASLIFYVLQAVLSALIGNLANIVLFTVIIFAAAALALSINLVIKRLETQETEVNAVSQKLDLLLLREKRDQGLIEPPKAELYFLLKVVNKTLENSDELNEEIFRKFGVEIETMAASMPENEQVDFKRLNDKFEELELDEDIDSSQWMRDTGRVLDEIIGNLESSLVDIVFDEFTEWHIGLKDEEPVWRE